MRFVRVRLVWARGSLGRFMGDLKDYSSRFGMAGGFFMLIRARESICLELASSDTEVQ